MRKKFIFSLLAILMVITAYGQSRDLSRPSGSADYTQFFKDNKPHLWKLAGVASNDYYTGVFIDIEITNGKAGSLYIPDNVFIAGVFGREWPVGLQINGKDYSFNKTWSYMDGNKGKIVSVLLLFQRIPAGVSSLSFIVPNFVSWENIVVQDNPDMVEHSDWDEEGLRAYWTTHPCTKIEGIYYFSRTTDRKWWGECKHTLAVIRTGYQYEIIYLKGSNKAIWKEGDRKATFVATAVPDLYKATAWYMENRIENPDFYLKFSDGYMSIYEENSSVTADFLKLFPANDTNLKGGGASGQSHSAPQEGESTVLSTGSGIFVAPRIITTNYHVIKKASKIEVSVRNGKEVCSYKAKVLSTDKTNDLALIQIEDKDFTGIGRIPYQLLTTIKDTGTSIFTMGFPVAEYMGEEVKVTDGIISSKTGFQGDIVTYQISAPIQPGNSGGPLFDKNGCLIGITNALLRGGENVGYAIKSSYLCNLIESAPVQIQIPSDTSLQEVALPEQIKVLSQCVVFIKAYY